MKRGGGGANGYIFTIKSFDLILKKLINNPTNLLISLAFT